MISCLLVLHHVCILTCCRLAINKTWRKNKLFLRWKKVTRKKGCNFPGVFLQEANCPNITCIHTFFSSFERSSWRQRWLYVRWYNLVFSHLIFPAKKKSPWSVCVCSLFHFSYNYIHDWYACIARRCRHYVKKFSIMEWLVVHNPFQWNIIIIIKKVHRGTREDVPHMEMEDFFFIHKPFSVAYTLSPCFSSSLFRHHRFVVTDEALAHSHTCTFFCTQKREMIRLWLRFLLYFYVHAARYTFSHQIYYFPLCYIL